MTAGGLIKATGVSTFRKHLKKALDDVYNNNKSLIVTRPEDENVVVLSEELFNDFQKEINNLKYLLKISESDKEIEQGKIHKIDLETL